MSAEDDNPSTLCDLPRARDLDDTTPMAQLTEPLRRTVLLVAVLNLAYFGVEFVVALNIGSVSLLADSVDFLEDAAVNLLIFAALGWSPARRAQVGMALAAILLIPALAFLWAVWRKFEAPAPPEAVALTLTGLGALTINLSCAFLLTRYRHHGGSLTKAAFLSARNDALANIAIIGAGIATVFTRSLWPDLIVGLGIAVMNLDAARAVWTAARREHAAVQPLRRGALAPDIEGLGSAARHPAVPPRCRADEALLGLFGAVGLGDA
ncbi:cation transporter [Phenylobacterium sp.]|uniref:cation transporter n=1 Tax=Phenylobacterium sp. TaxID=1871053 RepID=UPI0025FD1084|nr:cation diffusion facilitator family transporter [Phenylobacterium sp.]